MDIDIRHLKFERMGEYIFICFLSVAFNDLKLKKKKSFYVKVLGKIIDD